MAEGAGDDEGDSRGNPGRGEADPRSAPRGGLGGADLGFVVVCGLVLAVCPASPAVAGPVTAPQPLMRLADERLAESSGLAVSHRAASLLWTLTDSGGRPELYGLRAGRIVAVARVAGARNVDWEALAPGPDGTLWIGDIGDNFRRRDSVTLYEVPEPAASGRSTVRARVHRLRYPDGPHDAEALLVHPRTGRVLVVTKELLSAGGVYAAARPSGGSTTVLRRVGDAPRVVTDGAYAPNGRRLALRTYASAVVRDGVDGTDDRVALPAQPQGEALAWAPDGRALLAGSEGTGSTVWRVPVTLAPAPSSSAPPASPPATSRPAPAAAPAGGSTAWRAYSVGVLSVTTAAVALRLRRAGPRRSRRSG